MASNTTGKMVSDARQIAECVSRKRECAGSDHIVTADHPTFRRPDKKFTGYKSFVDAIDYAGELVESGYENVLVSECD